MIQALIENEGYAPLLLDFPIRTEFLEMDMKGIGIDIPPDKLMCNLDDENGITVKLFGKDDVENRIAFALSELPIGDVNRICTMMHFTSAFEKKLLRRDISENGVESYEDLIRKVEACRAAAQGNMAHPLLFGESSDGKEELHSVKEVAEFIIKHGKNDDVIITKEDGSLFIDTFGIYINRIADRQYRDHLLPVLIPMQIETEKAAFDSADEDVGMGGM